MNGQVHPNPNNDVLFNSKPFETFYSINGGEYITYTQSLNIDSAGTYKIAYYTVDLMENRSAEENVIITIDTTPPPQNPPPQNPHLRILRLRLLPLCSPARIITL